MHQTLKQRFINAFPEMLEELKIDHCLVPVMRLFIEQLEKHGFSLEETLISLSLILEDRNLKEAAASIEKAAKYADPVYNNSEET